MELILPFADNSRGGQKVSSQRVVMSCPLCGASNRNMCNCFPIQEGGINSSVRILTRALIAIDPQFANYKDLFNYAGAYPQFPRGKILSREWRINGVRVFTISYYEQPTVLYRDAQCRGIDDVASLPQVLGLDPAILVPIRHFIEDKKMT